MHLSNSTTVQLQYKCSENISYKPFSHRKHEAAVRFWKLTRLFRDNQNCINQFAQFHICLENIWFLSNSNRQTHLTSEWVFALLFHQDGKISSNKEWKECELVTVECPSALLRFHLVILPCRNSSHFSHHPAHKHRVIKRVTDHVSLSLLLPHHWNIFSELLLHKCKTSWNGCYNNCFYVSLSITLINSNFACFQREAVKSTEQDGCQKRSQPWHFVPWVSYNLLFEMRIIKRWNCSRILWWFIIHVHEYKTVFFKTGISEF